MDSIDSLDPAEWARHLGDPVGDVGLAVVGRIYESNAPASTLAVAELGLHAADHVLEIGFGTGRLVPHVLAQADAIRFVGLDRSATMVEEARRYNVELVRAGRASFALGEAEAMPFSDAAFDCVFSIGVAHFWSAPEAALSEIRRVLRPGGTSMQGCLHPASAPPFARRENGFYLRDAAEWDAIHRAAGFHDVAIETLEAEGLDPNGVAIKRYVLRLAARG